MMKRARVLSCALASLLCGGAGALAHNGYGVAPLYSAPFGIIVSDGETPLTIDWSAMEYHEEQFYRFKVQATDFPPTPSPPSVMRQGRELASLPSTAFDYSYDLDISSIGHGAWRIYAEFDEPPNCFELEEVPILFVRKEADQPMPFGTLVTSPLEDALFVHESAPLEVQAVSPSPVTLKVEAGELIRDPNFPDFQLCLEFTWAPLFTIIENVEMVSDPAAGEGRWRYNLDWNTLDVPDGAYLLRVTATTADGHSEQIWSRRWINVEHPYLPGPDTDTDTDTDDTSDTDTDTETDTPSKDEGGCSGATGSAWALAGLALLTRRRR